MELNKKTILTVEDVASILNIGKAKAYEIVKTPGFPCIKFGRLLRIPMESFSIWLDSQCQN